MAAEPVAILVPGDRFEHNGQQHTVAGVTFRKEKKWKELVVVTEAGERIAFDPGATVEVL